MKSGRTRDARFCIAEEPGKGHRSEKNTLPESDFPQWGDRRGISKQSAGRAKRNREGQKNNRGNGPLMRDYSKHNINGQAIGMLEDSEILAVLAKRGHDLRIAEAFASLTRIMEAAGTKAPKEVRGLKLAVELTKLYSMNFAPSSPRHPFRGFDLTLSQIMNQEMNGGVPPTSAPKPPWAKVEASTPALIQLKPPAVVGSALGSQDIIKRSPSKVKRVMAALLQAGGEFNGIKGARGLVEFDNDIRDGDIANGIAALRSKNMLQKTDMGLWKLPDYGAPNGQG